MVIDSPFLDAEQLPVESMATLGTGPVLVVAPHPDDETLGCGGVVALLRDRGQTVRVLVVSDGSMSHPNSRLYPAEKLRDLREAETRAGLAVLGVPAQEVKFLRLKDGAVPFTSPMSAEAEWAIAGCQAYLRESPPETIFLPYQLDPHPDHRATWQLMQAAIHRLSLPARLIEYPIWDWDPKQRGELRAQQYRAWRIDISGHVQLKKQAISCYRSQTTDLITDDPEGFRLSDDLIANFTRNWEIYFESIC